MVSTETAFRSVEKANGSSSSEPLAFFLELPKASFVKESILNPPLKELLVLFSFGSGLGLSGVKVVLKALKSAWKFVAKGSASFGVSDKIYK